MMSAATAKPDYGIDAPRVIRSLFLIGALALLASPFVPPLRIGHVIFVFHSMFLGIGVVCIVEGILMILYAKYGKLWHRDRMLNRVTWHRDERVLDVGTGAGLLMIGAAKRLTTGRATGIDPWSKVDLAGNTRERALRNAEIEGVQEKVDVLDGDATAMKFPDASFGVVVSNLCLHNISTKAGREQACREIVRVLKPGGQLVISDFIKTRQYEQVFRDCGIALEPGSTFWWSTFPPLRVICGKKPGTALGQRANKCE
jgi:SAM-dependent methyltransferase